MLLTKLIAALLSPLPLVGLILLVAWVMRWLNRTRLAATATCLAVALFLVFSVEPLARYLILPLENRYEAITQPEAFQNVRWILVLGSSASEDADAPPTTRLSGIASLRLAEGLRLQNALPESTLILSGGSVFGDAPSATVMSRAAIAMGADPDRLRIHPNPLNTRQEAEFMREAVGDAPFLLVTSASHMPRAMMLNRKADLNPIPAPTARRTSGNVVMSDPAFWLPSARALEISESAMHEYMGIAWAWLRGHI
ncbi:MAG: ElyC/SanA/YdcF family protein [Pseudomonadota bacterium]